MYKALPLPPILYYHFRRPLPYTQTLALQERLHRLQLSKRESNSHKDILLLLQHRPVYTAGRRQKDEYDLAEETRMTTMGADFEITTRGGQLTYHGPGQMVGYPLIDLARYTPTMGARDYVCRMQKTLELHLKEAHGIETTPSDHTGVFLDETTKIASIGVQIRHRLTSHGFSLNITREPAAWFDQIVACGLSGVRAGSVETALSKAVDIDAEMDDLAGRFGRLYEREVIPMDISKEGEMGEAIALLETEAIQAGPWATVPKLS
ncbi:hypothetical protein H0H92_004593 [Tricholoma furcatifolium]|nr:hypothetical protein H0H92_004593 [Tricholoma furcatifolium]